MVHIQKSKKELFDEIKSLFTLLIAEDRSFLWLAIIYGIAISLLTLAVPVSVQVLINTVANTASARAVIILSMALMLLLLISGGLNLLQVYVLELFERRFYARVTGEFALRNIYADYNYYERINRYELVNRYFDIMSVQHILPSLIIGFFALGFQMIVGVILVSSYHPALFLFNLCFVLVLWLIWRVWGYSAMATALEVSESKYETARHLEDMARANSFFKLENHLTYGLRKTDKLIHNYIQHRKSHFYYTFSQKAGLFLLYALASAALLGIGGLLVVNGELTLGQLVAAELILSSVFYGLSHLGAYLAQFYSLGAGLEEISRIYQLPMEKNTGKMALPAELQPIRIENAAFDWPDEKYIYNFEISPAQKILASCSNHSSAETLLRAFKHYYEPDSGYIFLGNHPIIDYDIHLLRQKIIILDRPTIIECTVKEYLQLGNPSTSMAELHQVLEYVELEKEVQQLENGLDTLLTETGLPLTLSQTLRLKLASAWISKPQLLILTELFDTISYSKRQRIFDRLCKDKSFSLLYFTNQHNLKMFDSYLFVEPHKQHWLQNLEELRQYEETHEGSSL